MSTMQYLQQYKGSCSVPEENWRILEAALALQSATGVLDREPLNRVSGELLDIIWKAGGLPILA
jgi:hypothetical protein